MRTWKRTSYTVIEISHNYDLHAFAIINRDGEIIATIYPNTLFDMQEIIIALDNGACVDGWEDGLGGVISI